jgi:hypothetical protein
MEMNGGPFQKPSAHFLELGHLERRRIRHFCFFDQQM